MILVCVIQMSRLDKFGRQFISNFDIARHATASKRGLILSILKSTTTKREAKKFLSKYRNQFDFDEEFGEHKFESNSLSKQENQRDYFVNRFINGENPFTNIYEDEASKLTKIPLRIALFKLSMSNLKPDICTGITETFRRLIELGVSPMIVCDPEDCMNHSFQSDCSHLMEIAQKISQEFSKDNGSGSLQCSILRSPFRSKNCCILIDSLEQLLIPLYQGVIPVIIPVLYDSFDGTQRIMSSRNSLYHLCSELVNYSDMLTIEKIIFLDKLGGIPSIERNQTSHVFINLSQEFSDIVSELYIGHLKPDERETHLSNLRSMNEILGVVSENHEKNDATGIITTPWMLSHGNNIDVLNPVVYNILTDRPVISSSLPYAHKRTPQVSTSIIKKGFDVFVIDKHSYSKEFTLSNLTKDGLIDKGKLFGLINDSFGKKLNVQQYEKRINSSLASIVIIGDYDGAAIITWEVLANGEKIAYLDKFAIAKKNQGLPSLADIIFKLITQLHQHELLWRSRADNPVNKWYFERSRGNARIPKSSWKFFYTGDIFNDRLGTRIDGSMSQSIDINEKLELYSKLIESLPPSF